jgi:hypothetical protein
MATLWSEDTSVQLWVVIQLALRGSSTGLYKLVSYHYQYQYNCAAQVALDYSATPARHQAQATWDVEVGSILAHTPVWWSAKHASCSYKTSTARRVSTTMNPSEHKGPPNQHDRAVDWFVNPLGSKGCTAPQWTRRLFQNTVLLWYQHAEDIDTVDTSRFPFYPRELRYPSIADHLNESNEPAVIWFAQKSVWSSSWIRTVQYANCTAACMADLFALRVACEEDAVPRSVKSDSCRWRIAF